MTVAASVPTYPAQSWRDHLRARKEGRPVSGRWTQGDHVLICGPTKAGKTTLMSDLVRLRSHVVVFVSKLEDATFREEFKGWTVLREWPKDGPRPWQTHILLWPRAVDNDMRASLAIQQRVFRDALNRLLTRGRWCIVIDEAMMFSDPKFIGLGAELGHMMYWARSSGISMVILAQRPAWLPRVIKSSVSHAYVSRTMDRDDMKSLADLGGLDMKAVAENLGRLPTRHDYLYLNPQGDATPVVVNTRR